MRNLQPRNFFLNLSKRNITLLPVAVFLRFGFVVVAIVTMSTISEASSFAHYALSLVHRAYCVKKLA